MDPRFACNQDNMGNRSFHGFLKQGVPLRRRDYLTLTFLVRVVASL